MAEPMTPDELRDALDDLSAQERRDLLIYLQGYSPDGFACGIEFVHTMRALAAARQSPAVAS